MVDVGARPGGYELVAKLGHGGMATLWLAKRAGAAGFERLAAVKVIHPHLAENDRFTLMLIDEAKVSSRVQHPNVVRVEHFGDHEGTYFLAMEYVHGCPLSKLLRGLARRRLKLAPSLAVRIAMAVADGLHAAHTAKDETGRPLQIVHRDVSPQNILLSYGGHVKLIDFGIAKARFRAQETKSIRIKGKLGYMSPEQVLMKSVGPHTDVYALAIVLWEMLTMRRYFSADNELAMLDMIRAPTPVPPSRYADVPHPLDEVVINALDPDAEKRPRSARELRRALGRACPEALGVDEADLASLLEEVMEEERAQLTGKIPASVIEQLRANEPTCARSRHTLTQSIEIEGEGWTEDTFDESAPVAAEEPHEQLEVSSAEDLESADSIVETVPLSKPAPRLRRIAAAAAFGVIVAAASAAGVLAYLTSEDQPSPAVTVPRAMDGPRPETDPTTEELPTGLDPPSIALAPVEAVEDEAPAEPSITARARSCAEEADHSCVVELLADLEEPSEAQLAMLVDAHLARGNRRRARLAARRYLRAFPEGPEAERLRELARPRASRRGAGAPSPNPAGDLPFSDTL